MPRKPAATAALEVDFNSIWAPDSVWEKLSREQLESINMDYRRVIFWNPQSEVVACVAQRSIRKNGKAGNFAIDVRTLRLLNNIRNIKDCRESYVVLVEEVDDPEVLSSISSIDLKRRLHNKPMLEKEGSRYWWVSANFRYIHLGKRGGYHYGVTAEPLWMQHLKENPIPSDESI